MSDWSEPLYLPPTGFPSGTPTLEFAGVTCGVVVTDTDPLSAPAQWMSDREVALLLAEDVGPVELAALLPEFLHHAESLADRPTSAEVMLASRDVDRGRIVRAAGLAPSSVLAVADLQHDIVRAVPWQDNGGAGIVVRDACAADTDAVVRLWHEQVDYEGRIGTLRDSEPVRIAIAESVPEYLGGTADALVAERDGAVVAVVVAESPDSSGWVGVRLTQAPVSYLAMASTDPQARGGGIGAMLVGVLHERQRAAGIRLSALHYSQYNPLSVPFWSQQGYRPVLTFFSRAVG